MWAHRSLAFDNRRGEKQAYFGPVITRVPSTEDSLDMWDSLVTMMNIDGFWELKRHPHRTPGVRHPPVTGDGETLRFRAWVTVGWWPSS